MHVETHKEYTTKYYHMVSNTLGEKVKWKKWSCMYEAECDGENDGIYEICKEQAYLALMLMTEPFAFAEHAAKCREAPVASTGPFLSWRL